MRLIRFLVLPLAVVLMVGGSSIAFGESDSGGVTVGSDGPGRYSGRTTFGYQSQSTKRVPTAVSGTPGPVKKVPKPRMTAEQWKAFLAMCLATYGDQGCAPGDSSAKDEPDEAAAGLALDAIARQLVVRLQLPDPTPRIGPDPSDNEWGMAAVGYPLWLWTAGPRRVTAVESAHGVTFTLRAVWVSTTFGMGDGRSVTCTATKPYTDSVTPGTPSPACGYVYRKASLPKGDYTVTATTRWRISWSALGQSGTLGGSHSGSRPLPVGELHALVVG